jgi:hypothetical protein
MEGCIMGHSVLAVPLTEIARMNNGTVAGLVPSCAMGKVSIG